VPAFGVLEVRIAMQANLGEAYDCDGSAAVLFRRDWQTN
jgi:hypothetical protein